MTFTHEELLEISNELPIKFYPDDYLHGYFELNKLGKILSLIVYDYEQGENYESCQLVRSLIKNLLNYVINCGFEPTFDNCHNWGYPTLCQSFALIKNKEALWNLFTQDEQNRITCLMKMFALMWNFGCNKYNSYRSGIGLHGNYKKNLNPNYMLSNEAIILYCTCFFGDIKKVSSIMMNTKYDDLIEELKAYGFNNAYKTWTTDGVILPDGTKSAGARELFGDLKTRRETKNYWVHMYRKDKEGNILYLGKGKGCCLPFYYDKRDAKLKDYTSYPTLVYEKIINKCFNGGICKDSIAIDTEENFSTHIVDGTSSPYNGLEGMMTEFNNKDWGGTRSSIFHCEIDFYLIVMMIESLKLLGINILNETEVKSKVLTGMNDFLYKKERGYIGYCLGKIENTNRNFKLEKWIEHWRDNYQEV